MYQTVGLIILGVLFLFSIVVFNQRRNEGTLIKGFWSGGDEFCRSAGLDIFLMYVGDGFRERPGYLIMRNSDGFIVNNPFKLYISGGFSMNPSTCNCLEYSVSIDWLDDEPPAFFPSDQSIHYYPTVGKMVWSKDDTVYAVIYKNNQISDAGDTVPNKVKNIDDEYMGSETI